jgi:hypothetical protein
VFNRFYRDKKESYSVSLCAFFVRRFNKLLHFEGSDLPAFQTLYCRVKILRLWVSEWRAACIFLISADFASKGVSVQSSRHLVASAFSTDLWVTRLQGIYSSAWASNVINARLLRECRGMEALFRGLCRDRAKSSPPRIDSSCRDPSVAR